MKKVSSLLMAAAILGSSVAQTSAFADSQVGDQGTGEAKVTYNASHVIDPDVGTDPDFAVVIPSGYALSNDTTIAKDKVMMADKDDLSKAYAGNTTIKVNVASQNAFKFVDAGSAETGATYKLTDGGKDGNALTEFVMSKDAAEKEADAVLTKKANKTVAASDTLTFNYEVTAVN